MTVGYVAGTQRNKPFGIDLYKPPKANHNYRIMSLGKNEEKRKNFAQTIGESFKWVPGPKYMPVQDWRENIKGRRGKFL